MIPASDIRFSEDGTRAWVVASDPRNVWGSDTMNDRPCDTCLCPGDGDLCGDGGPHQIGASCPDCSGTGRHTFNIEVAVQTEVDAYESDTYRVSVLQVRQNAKSGDWIIELAVHKEEET